jgi:PAS domain S-box-containing protein
VQGELVHRTRSCERRVVASQQIVYRDAGGRPLRILEVNADLTEVHQAEQARRQAEQRFSLLARSVRDYAIFLMDPEGRITHWNEGAARVKGYTEAEVLGQHVSLFYPPDQLAAGRPQRQLQEAAAQGRSHEENWRVRKGGERFWGDELIAPLRVDESGALLGFAKICRNLTERKAAEDERARLLAAEQAARKEAEEANRAKDRFLAALSHELRTPLTPVRLALFALEQDAQLSAAAREALALIGRNVEVECRLIDDLLDISRVVHGKLALRPVPLDLVRLRARSPGGLPRRTDRQGLASDGKLGGDPTPAHGRSLAPAAGVLEPAAERGQITPEGGAITVRSRDREGGGVAVEVADTGAGISPELLPKIFDAFERGASQTPLGLDGLGLGLAIAQAIVQAHGGRLLAASAGEDQGATFTVELPAHPEKGAAG